MLTCTNKSLKYLKVDDKQVIEPFKFLIAISWVGDMQLEIIQPVCGPTIYEAFIEKHGEGLHPLRALTSRSESENAHQSRFLNREWWVDDKGCLKAK